MVVVGCFSNCILTEGLFPLLLLLLLLLPLDRRKRRGLRSGDVTTAEAGMPVPVVTVCSPRVSMRCKKKRVETAGLKRHNVYRLAA
jgi:hypothetical protein